MRRTVIAIAIGAVLAAAACSGDLSPGATVLQAVGETSDAGSARVAYAATFDTDATQEPVALTGEGVFDYANQRGRMVFDMSQVMRGSEGTSPEGSAEVEMIFEGVTLYMKMPFLTQLVSSDRPWLKLDLEAARRAGRTDLAQLIQLGESEPTQVVELLRGTTKGVDDVGTERVRGTRTTHYELVLDLGRAVEKASDGARASVESLITRGRSLRLPADVWIDEEGRMRKMTYGLELASSSTTGTREDRMTVSMELYEFGIDVDVQAPPPDRVIDLLDLLDQPQGAP
jgi:hypothetical protein